MCHGESESFADQLHQTQYHMGCLLCSYACLARCLLWPLPPCFEIHFTCWRVQVWWTVENVLVPWFIIPVLKVEPLPSSYTAG
jgi:hypothetical protein